VIQKALILSILLASIIIPCAGARDVSPVRGLRRTILWFLGFNMCYLVAVLYVLPRLP
jgi:hypothetical protein